VEAVIAGPLQEDIAEMRDEFVQRPNAKYLGPVYGADKQRFFEQLDFLVFPSYYANEAEPLVVLESLSYGVPVIATKRGCLESMLAGGAGIVIDGESDDFVTESVAFIRSSTTEDHAHMRVIARRTFERHQEQATAVLNEVLATICAKA
jgi:glycosyltransferase involved in cell wall biosynthesis